jgi:hypothetical protein
MPSAHAGPCTRAPRAICMHAPTRHGALIGSEVVAGGPNYVARVGRHHWQCGHCMDGDAAPQQALSPGPSVECMQVIGVGGGGSNAVNSMHASNLQGVELFVANTDAQVGWSKCGLVSAGHGNACRHA